MKCPLLLLAMSLIFSVTTKADEEDCYLIPHDQITLAKDQLIQCPKVVYKIQGDQKLKSLVINVGIKSAKPPHNTVTSQDVVLDNLPLGLAYTRNYENEHVWKNPVILQMLKKRGVEASSISFITIKSLQPTDTSKMESVLDERKQHSQPAVRSAAPSAQ